MSQIPQNTELFFFKLRPRTFPKSVRPTGRTGFVSDNSTRLTDDEEEEDDDVVEAVPESDEEGWTKDGEDGFCRWGPSASALEGASEQSSDPLLLKHSQDVCHTSEISL